MRGCSCCLDGGAWLRQRRGADFSDGGEVDNFNGGEADDCDGGEADSSGDGKVDDSGGCEAPSGSHGACCSCCCPDGDKWLRRAQGSSGWVEGTSGVLDPCCVLVEATSGGHNCRGACIAGRGTGKSVTSGIVGPGGGAAFGWDNGTGSALCPWIGVVGALDLLC